MKSIAKKDSAVLVIMNSAQHAELLPTLNAKFVVQDPQRIRVLKKRDFAAYKVGNDYGARVRVPVYGTANVKVVVTLNTGDTLATGGIPVPLAPDRICEVNLIWSKRGSLLGMGFSKAVTLQLMNSKNRKLPADSLVLLLGCNSITHPVIF